MAKPRYLYIDDENDSSVEAIRDGFNDLDIIEVVIEQPQDFKIQKKHLIEKMQDFDGIILDLRLDGNLKLDVSYNAPAIALELRTFTSDACPIILCSTDEQMRATYDTDKSSHDLFDYKFLKGSKPDWLKFSNKLSALALGYKFLKSKERGVSEILGRDDIDILDQRIIELFSDSDLSPSINEIAQFIITGLFNHPGPLIKERVLAARLGIDIAASGEAWNNLLIWIEEWLPKAKYSGIFSDGWFRWWSDQVILIFKNISDGKRLALLEAEQRVEVIKGFSEIEGLKAAKPLQYCNSTSFWTICEGHKKPIDPIEGYKVFETSVIKSWQESKYISFDAAVNRIGKEKGLRIHPSEVVRFESDKEILSEK